MMRLSRMQIPEESYESMLDSSEAEAECGGIFAMDPCYLQPCPYPPSNAPKRSREELLQYFSETMDRLRREAAEIDAFEPKNRAVCSANGRNGLSLIEILAAVFVLMIGILGILAVLPFGGLQLQRMNRADFSANCGRAAVNALALRNYMSDPLGICNVGGTSTAYSYIPFIVDPRGSGTFPNSIQRFSPTTMNFDFFMCPDDLSYGWDTSSASDARPKMAGGSDPYYGNFTWLYMLTPHVSSGATITAGTPPTVDYADIHGFDVDVVVVQRRGDNERAVSWSGGGLAGGSVTISDSDATKLELTNTDWILITAPYNTTPVNERKIYAKWHRIVNKGEIDTTAGTRDLMLLGPDIPLSELSTTGLQAYIIEGVSTVFSLSVPKD